MFHKASHKVFTLKPLVFTFQPERERERRGRGEGLSAISENYLLFQLEFSKARKHFLPSAGKIVSRIKELFRRVLHKTYSEKHCGVLVAVYSKVKGCVSAALL